MKKIFKIISIIAAAIFTILAAIFLIAYLKYNTPIPKGKQGIQAEQLANKILEALNYDAYKNTNYLSWKANGVTYVWNKKSKSVTISWENTKLIFDQDNPSKSNILRPKDTSEKEKKKLLQKLKNYLTMILFG
ncbi:hypothetical protein [Aquimarina agarivorans]|uniref:hypothetical protein n=1 Tax=Aquimarina agarivorans TaxID=980584 RepID=UPI000307C210|nr:hypothetical protein [Aquimarina agarivorans]